MSFMPLDVNVRVIGAANAKAQITSVGGAMQQAGTKADLFNRKMAANKSNIRGLAIGLSAVFGTITGVIAEFQLLADAQKKVADSTAELTRLEAEGKKGTLEYSRAQASLAKDQRFLSFSTRNLSLVLANFIPEAILIATSLKKMRDAQALVRLQSQQLEVTQKALTASTIQSTVATDAQAVSQRALATSATPLVTAMSGIGIQARRAATSAAPLAGIFAATGNAATVTATRVGLLSRALIFLKANIRGVLLATGIGAALVAIGFLAERFLSAADSASEAGDRISDTISGMAESAESLVEVGGFVVEGFKAGFQGFDKQLKELSDQAKLNWDKLVLDAKEGGNSLRTQVLTNLSLLKVSLEAQIKSIQDKGVNVLDLFLGLIQGKPGTVPQQAILDKLNKGVASLDEIIQAVKDTYDTTTPSIDKFNLSQQQTAEVLAAVTMSYKNSMAAAQNVAGIIKGMVLQGDIDKAKEYASSIIGMQVAFGLLTPEAAKRALDIINESVDDYASTLDDGGKKTEKFVDNTSAAAKAILEADKSYTQLTSDLGKLMDVQDANLRQLESFKALYADNIQVHIDQMLAIKDESEFWVRLNEEQYQAAISAQEFTYANINVTESLEDSRKTILARNAAMIEGKLAAQEIINNAVLETIRTDELNRQLNIQTQLWQRLLPAGMKLTNSQMEEIIKTSASGESGFEVLANIINEKLAPAFERFSSVIGAKTWKDFKKNFKEIDFGSLGGKAKNLFKDVFNDMRKVSDSGNEILTIMDAMTLAFSNDRLTKPALRMGFEAIVDSLDKVVKNDPEGKFLKPFMKFLDSLDKKTREAAFILLGDQINYLGTAISNGDLTPAEVMAFYEKLGLTINSTTEEISNAVQEMMTFGTTVKNLKNLKAPDIFQDTSAEIEGLEPPKIEKAIDPLVTATETLTTSTDNLKTSIDTLNTTISGITNIADSYPGGGGFDQIPGMKGGRLLKIGAGGDGGETADPFGVQLVQMIVKIAAAKEKIVQFFKEIEVAAQQLQTGLANLAIQGANSLGILAAGSSTAANGIDANLSVAEVAAQDLQTGLANLSNEGIKSMAALAKESSVMANGIKNNMKVAVAAVNSLKSAINSLKSKTVTVSVKVSQAEGGIMSFAKGGVMSAAKGRMFTAHGEQLITVGDNPGGNETVAFIPHNNPYPIVDRILEMFGTRANNSGAFGGGTGRGGGSQPIIVQVYMDNQRMENHLVKTVTRRAAAFK